MINLLQQGQCIFLVAFKLTTKLELVLPDEEEEKNVQLYFALNFIVHASRCFVSLIQIRNPRYVD